STAGSDFPVILALYTGSAVASLNQIASTTTGQLSFNGVSGTAYALAIDGMDGQTGNIVLTVGNPPSNDDFFGATTLSGSLPITTTGNNFYATKQGGEPNHGGDLGG